MKKFTFKLETGDYTLTFKHKDEGHSVYSILDKFTQFLQASGYTIDGYLDICSDEEYYSGFEDEDEPISQEVATKEVKNWFSSIPAFVSDNGDIVENFNLKECFEVQDKLTMEKN